MHGVRLEVGSWLNDNDTLLMAGLLVGLLAFEHHTTFPNLVCCRLSTRRLQGAFCTAPCIWQSTRHGCWLLSQGRIASADCPGTMAGPYWNVQALSLACALAAGLSWRLTGMELVSHNSIMGGLESRSEVMQTRLARQRFVEKDRVFPGASHVPYPSAPHKCEIATSFQI